jgi:hypothetical protein
MQGASWLRSNHSTLKLHLQLAATKSAPHCTRPLAAPFLWNRMFLNGLVSLSWPWGLHLAAELWFFFIRGCYFCEKLLVSHPPFTCLLLKCLPHPKWSHLCHCSLTSQLGKSFSFMYLVCITSKNVC